MELTSYRISKLLHNKKLKTNAKYGYSGNSKRFSFGRVSEFEEHGTKYIKAYTANELITEISKRGVVIRNVEYTGNTYSIYRYFAKFQEKTIEDALGMMLLDIIKTKE